MNAIDNSKIQNADISLGLLLETLAHAKNIPLVFHYDGKLVKAGYHVTEVKAGKFDALDCSANPESWTEIFVQLWDIEEGDRTHMPAGKFAAIIRKVSEHVKLDGSAKLTFEVSDGVQPMQLYQAAYPSLRAGQVHVELTPRAASCKPRNRWLAEENRKAAAACCGPAVESKCCG
ncbi:MULTISPECIES: DUF6428 family protein [Rhizobium]|uniref:Uncharacterized protein n=1 Tax=Rhizobium paranaense TaxID=1650438 RepID=A0A7W8XYC6_9HYPH|nr:MULTISPECIES: DUF6428 family protein [Rhizobium]MBB5577858.1 hypothetical protein [Rhizobium paranaense]PST64671.1 hypothetical protein C9E91_01670 [Rhizobium sp. SEMIA4064]